MKYGVLVLAALAALTGCKPDLEPHREIRQYEVVIIDLNAGTIGIDDVKSGWRYRSIPVDYIGCEPRKIQLGTKWMLPEVTHEDKHARRYRSIDLDALKNVSC